MRTIILKISGCANQSILITAIDSFNFNELAAQLNNLLKNAIEDCEIWGEPIDSTHIIDLLAGNEISLNGDNGFLNMECEFLPAKTIKIF